MAQSGERAPIIAWSACRKMGISVAGFRRHTGKLVFEAPLPSPLGRVAERSEVGRGSLPPCISFAFPQTKAKKPLPSALRAAFFPQRGRQGATRNQTANNNLFVRLLFRLRKNALYPVGIEGVKYAVPPLIRHFLTKMPSGRQTTPLAVSGEPVLPY